MRNLTYKLKEFYKLDTGDSRYEVWIWIGFDKSFTKLTKGDSKGSKKVLSWIERLAKRIPSGEDKARPLKGEICQKYNIYELKPKPYRIAFVCLCDRYILIGYIWKKRANTQDSKEIKKACELMEGLIQKFKKEVANCS